MRVKYDWFIKISIMIHVTKTYLPPLEEFNKYLQKIWRRKWVTNHGPLVNELEEKLREYLGVKHIFFLANGTIALQIAIKILNLNKEIITTPFTYVATISSIVWEKCTPVFVDIDPKTLCIDSKKIESAITKRTQAIMPVHVYGNACAVEEIEQIAKRNNIRVIYDAAHAFGVTFKDNSLLNYGDISTLSFHATKLFHTIEGGALVTNDDELAHKISYYRNFGHNGPEDFFGLGVNAKNSEVHAAMGLCILPIVETLIKKRRVRCELYDNLLLAKSSLRKPANHPLQNYNYSYYPVIFRSEKQLVKVKNYLSSNNIFPRRYFYPSLTKLNYVHSSPCPIAEDIAPRILCLPLYVNLPKKDVKRISELILDSL